MVVKAALIGLSLKNICMMSRYRASKNNIIDRPRCTKWSTVVNILPLRSKLLKSLQNEAIFSLITMNVLIYASDLSNQSY